MERMAWKGRIKPGCKAEYQRRHNEIWPEMVEVLKSAGICNYSIFYVNEGYPGTGDGPRDRCPAQAGTGVPSGLIATKERRLPVHCCRAGGFFNQNIPLLWKKGGRPDHRAPAFAVLFIPAP